MLHHSCVAPQDHALVSLILCSEFEEPAQVSGETFDSACLDLL